MNTMPRLSIAIPTFNRNSILAHHLPLLLEQLNDECELLILDNASETPIGETLAVAFGPEIGGRLRVLRHPVNLGASANVMRCFEVCRAPWLWILSDAYPVQPHAISTLLAYCKSNSNIALVNFAHHEFGRISTELRGLEDFTKGIDRFGNVLMLAECLFNARLLRPHLRVGYQMAHSLAPQFAMVLAACARGAACYLATERLAGSKAHVGQNNWAISRYPAVLALCEVEMTEGCRRALAKKIVQDILLHFRSIVLECCVRGLREGDSRKYTAEFQMFLLRAKYAGIPLHKRLLIFAARVAVSYPMVVNVFWRMKHGSDLISRPCTGGATFW
jgi:abequosyltransferase